jgi:hypothetical protein
MPTWVRQLRGADAIAARDCCGEQQGNQMVGKIGSVRHFPHPAPSQADANPDMRDAIGDAATAASSG